MRILPHKTNWFRWLFCRHEFASDPLEFSKICCKCGWHNNYALGRVAKILYRIDKRGTIIGQIVHVKERAGSQ